MRRIRLAAAHRGEGSVENRVEGSKALFDGGRINIDFEGRPDLPLRLRRTVKFRFIKAVTADHGLDFTGRIVNRHNGCLRADILLQLDVRGSAIDLLDVDLDEIARLQQLGRRLVPGPCKIRLREQRAKRADFDRRRFLVHGRHEALDVVAFVDRPAPVIVFIRVQRVGLVREDVVKLAPPAVPAVVGMEAVANGAVGGLLHRDVEGRVHAQTSLMHHFRAIGALKIFANLLDKIRRQRISRRLQMQPQRLRDGLPELRGRDFARMLHEFQNQIAPTERALRMKNRRITRAADQSREQCRFLHIQLADRLAKVIFRSRFKSVVPVGKINLIAIHSKNLLLGVVTFDLKCQERLLNLSAHPAIGAVQKKSPGKLHGNGARALHDAVRDKILPGRAGHAREIHAPMLLEVLILGGQNRVLQDLWILFVSEKNSALQGEVADHLAVVGVEFGDNIGLKIFESVNLREITRIYEHQACQAADGNRP